jgi:hypothetical protein
MTVILRFVAPPTAARDFAISIPRTFAEAETQQRGCVGEIDIPHRNMAMPDPERSTSSNSSFKSEIRAMSLSIASNGLTLPNLSGNNQDCLENDDDVQQQDI